MEDEIEFVNGSKIKIIPSIGVIRGGTSRNIARILYEMVYNDMCPECRESVPKKEIEKRKMNTAYVNEEENYLTSCNKCFDSIEQHWKEMWENHGHNQN
jgi:hypothetical protein